MLKFVAVGLFFVVGSALAGGGHDTKVDVEKKAVCRFKKGEVTGLSPVLV